MGLPKTYPGRVVSRAYVLCTLGDTIVTPTERRKGPSKAELAQHPNAEQWSFLHDVTEEDYDAEADLFEQTRYAEPVERVSLFDRTLIGGDIQERAADAIDLSDSEAVAGMLNSMEQQTVRAANALLEEAGQGRVWLEDEEEADADIVEPEDSED
jgi:hypothetical protein